MRPATLHQGPECLGTSMAWRVIRSEPRHVPVRCRQTRVCCAGFSEDSAALQSFGNGCEGNVMTDQTATPSNQNTIVIALVGIAVVLAAIVGYMLWQQSSALPPAQPAQQVPADSQGIAPTDGGQGGAAPGAEAGAAGAGAPTEAPPIDPASAVALPEGTSPEQWVTEYYEATENGDFQTAVSHLPADKQASTTPEGLQEQLAGYGITGFSVVSATEEGDQAVVVVDQTTNSFGTFENTWTFAKTDGGWVIASKAVTGMK
jgi:hypothetical protein